MAEKLTESTTSLQSSNGDLLFPTQVYDAIVNRISDLSPNLAGKDK